MLAAMQRMMRSFRKLLDREKVYQSLKGIDLSHPCCDSNLSKGPKKCLKNTLMSLRRILFDVA